MRPNRILRQAQRAAQLNWLLQAHGGDEAAEDCRSTSHVTLHPGHKVRRFQRQAAAVIHNAFSDQCNLLLRSILGCVRQRDEAWRLRCAFPHRIDTTVATIAQLLTANDVNGASQGFGIALRDLCKCGSVQQICWGVHEALAELRGGRNDGQFFR
ncbi:hypothetical protein DQ04_09111010 [Trypanosoma grayi]|uniref:hypothetical protein n=1 Tax=Trypanosoma grayi TaxID=71804 RepID=UPI0004F481B9|nr:hypothetical protein DQ04_09111010 [Trypanosoma grayi]KEG07680.1 hypothetical protein DQ04_09111010 [Trypanosoma grayi]